MSLIIPIAEIHIPPSVLSLFRSSSKSPSSNCKRIKIFVSSKVICPTFQCLRVYCGFQGNTKSRLTFQQTSSIPSFPSALPQFFKTSVIAVIHLRGTCSTAPKEAVLARQLVPKVCARHFHRIRFIFSFFCSLFPTVKLTFACEWNDAIKSKIRFPSI